MEIRIRLDCSDRLIERIALRVVHDLDLERETDLRKEDDEKKIYED